MLLILGPLRLVGGDYNEGRLEIYYAGSWGTFCNNSWDINDTRVACRQLGFEDAEIVYENAYFGEGSGPILMDEFRCRGFEASLSSCLRNDSKNHHCRHSQDVGVRCNGTGGKLK